MNAGVMSTNRPQSAPTSTGLILVFLALISLIGLLLGVLTHTLMTRQSTLVQTPPSATRTVASTPALTPTAQPTATAPTTIFTGRFDLSIAVNPKTLASGDQITITVYAYTPDTHAAIAGLPCILRAPIDGGASLLTTYPAAQTTDNAGTASWILTVPHQKAGTYEVEAYAQSKSWSFKTDSVVTVTGS